MEQRRPLKSRGTAWARGLAGALARAGASPDVLSASSVVFAAVGAGLLWVSADAIGLTQVMLLLGAAATIQLRLLVNLLDGMVAVEHGRAGPLGPIWNELPDRIADVLFLVGAGYALRHTWPDLGPALGWAAATLALVTAYVRELGRALGQPADFRGPGAKPHRMAVLTGASMLAATETWWAEPAPLLGLGLVVIVLLTALTAARRTARLVHRLKK